MTGDELLFEAIFWDRLEEVKKLLSNRGVFLFKRPPKASANATDKEGLTALHRVSTRGQHKIAELLIANGADVNAKDKNGQTPLHLAVEKGNTITAELLLDNGADLNSPDNRGDSPLQLALKDRSKGKLLIPLITKCSGVKNTSDGDGNPLLFWPSLRGDKDLVELLISKGADVNARTRVGLLTPLHCAVQKNNLAIAHLLIREGARVDVWGDAVGTTPLHYALEKGSEDLAKLMINKGADVNAVSSYFMGSDCKCTPLHLSVLNGYKEVLQLLIEKGADVNYPDISGRSPLILQQ